MSKDHTLPIAEMSFDGFGRITNVCIVSARQLTETDYDDIVNYVQRRNLSIHVQDEPTGVITLGDRAKAIEAATTA